MVMSTIQAVHTISTYMIDGEWYIFVANPDYEQCDSALGEACGVTIAHLNLKAVPLERFQASLDRY